MCRRSGGPIQEHKDEIRRKGRRRGGTPLVPIDLLSPLLGRAVLRVEIGLTDAKTTLERPSGAPKTSQRQPQNAPKAIFGSKKRANEAQESSKTNLEALFGRSRGPKELPRDPQELPKRAPKRFQNHLWIENVDFSKIELPPHKTIIFECRRVGS